MNFELAGKDLYKITLLTVFLLVLPFFSFSQLNGRVVSIADGDTFTLLMGAEKIRIRLHGIDCPEKSQAFGDVSKKFLSELALGKDVIVQKTDTDQYGRTIGILEIDSINVNEELLKAGLAWHYKRFDKNPIWTKLEEQARSDKQGLWIQKDPIPPWEFRKKFRE
jgi:micrococcal nuclease